jgi:protoporphyrinogen oxidase
VRALTELVEAQTRSAVEPADYRAWCLAQYGTYLTETFYDEFTAKYWRVPTAELATDWLGGRLLPSQLPRIVRGAFGQPDESQAVFAQFRYPARGGFFGFFEPLYRDLPVHYRERAVEIDPRRRRVAFASGRVEGYETLVSTVPLPKLVGLVKDAPAEVRAAAARLRHTQLLCVNVIVDRPRLTDCHWFYAYDREVEFSRVSVPSNLAPGSVPAGRTALQAEVFRRCDEPFDPAALAERTAAQLGDVLGFGPGEVVEAGHVVVPHAYVISDHARAVAVTAIRSWLADRGILTAGLYGRWKYIWSDEAFRQGRETAAEVLARRGLATRAG